MPCISNKIGAVKTHTKSMSSPQILCSGNICTPRQVNGMQTVPTGNNDYIRFNSIRFYRRRRPMAIHYVNGANGLANIVPATKTNDKLLCQLYRAKEKLIKTKHI